MSALPEQYTGITEAEYLAFERSTDTKHEFVDGEIYAMTGATRQHNLIVGSTYAALYAQLRGRSCESYPSDMKVYSPTTRAYFYPDISIVCGDVAEVDENDILLNPTVIIEILSPSTEAYDRGRKFQLYRELASLQEYLLIAQDRPYIERFLRQENDAWLLTEAQGLEASIPLTSIDCTLALAEVYEQVDFTAQAAPPSPPETSADEA